MKITIVNGSPRKGNTLTAINALIEGAGTAHEIEVIDADKLNISGCKGCGACECYKGCIADDDTNPTVDKIAESDLIVWAQPVYWWGVTAQTKLVIDKCYCKGAALKGKKIGLITIGGAATDNIQYELISKQFQCMSQFLNWEIVFDKAISASGTEDLAANAAELADLKKIGAEL